MALASPGVLIKEIDFTAAVQVADQNIGVVAIDAQKGPTDVVTYVSSERELVEIFGLPNDYNYESWFAANTIIQYGGVAAVIRPTGGSVNLGLNNANIKADLTSSASLVIRNKDQFQTLESGQKPFLFAARTAGSYNNGISVSIVDHGADQRVTVTPASGQVLAFDALTNGGATAGRTAGTYTIAATGGSPGTGATFTVVIAGNGAATVTLASGGSGYADNATLTLPRAGAYGGATDITVDVDGVGAPLPAVGSFIKWTVGSTDYKGNVFKVTSPDTLEVTLWDTTKRLSANTVLKNSAGTTIATVTAVTNDDVYGSLEYAPGRRWVAVAPQPGTSPVVASKGGKFDEFHIVVVDTDGNVSGTPGTVLETLAYASKASDARSTEGSSTFFKKVLEDLSAYIYAGDDAIAAGGELLTLTNQGTAADPGAVSANSIFKLFNYATGSVKSWKLGGGANYNYGTPSAITSVRSACVAAYDLVRDPETFGDIDFLVPGTISETAAVRLIDIAESRRDCMAVVSPRRTDVINSESSTAKTDLIISFFKTLPSSSFAIFDSGYKYIYDKYNDKYRYVPCAADIAGLCISTTINSETWFSPAGYNRGNLRNAQKLAYSPKQAERDRLYVNRVNPVVAFPGQGIVLFGDKTALASPSAFDRINVRRLFIELEKNVASFSKFQLFEINDEITRSGFKAAVEPYLRGVQGRRGIYDFLVVCDSSNNTPDVIDRNEFNAEIYIKPARSINFITITFVATRTGVSFNELIN